jgi:hypothetical protein
MLQKLLSILICAGAPMWAGALFISLGLSERPHNLLFLLGGPLLIVVGLGFLLNIFGVLPERRQRH